MGPGAEELPFSVLGHYEVVCAIGRGGMGDVYRGYERALDRSVALKVLPAEFSGEPEFVRRFYAEATAAARVIHPHVIPIHFIGEDAGRHFFAMQYVEGESLASLLARRGRLSVGETLDLLEQVLSGLSAAHQQGLIHRDIKPGNILLDRVHQRAVLADFGLVKSLASADGRTATGVVMGTADYIAPEQGRGQPVDHRCDLYAVGVLAYQLLSGKLPFAGDSPTAVIFQHVYERPSPLSDAVRDLPAGLDAVVAKLLAKSSELRHLTADAVLADLQAIRTGSPLPSGADRELAANPHAFMVGVPRANSRTAQTKVIRAPLLADEMPWPIVEPADRRTWWHRAKSWWDDWLRSKTPQWVQQLQSTQQQVEGGVAEYERRRDRLRRLVAEGDEVLATLQAALAQASDQTELRQSVADQEEQLATMRLRLAQDEARLRQLVNQRDLLQARLKAAYARQHVEGKSVSAEPRKQSRRLLQMRLAVGMTALVILVVYAVRNSAAIQQSFLSLFESSFSPPQPKLPEINPATSHGATAGIRPAVQVLSKPPERFVAVARHGNRYATSLFEPSKTVLIGVDDDPPQPEIKLWDLASGAELLNVKEPHRTLAIALCPNGETLMSAGRKNTTGEGEILFWDLKSNRIRHRLSEPIPHFRPAVGFSPDGTTAYALLGATLTQELGIIDLATGQVEHMRMPQNEDQASAAAFSPINDLAAIAVIQTGGSRRCAIDIHDLKLRSVVTSITASASPLQLAFSDDGRILAGAEMGRIAIWNTVDWTEIADFPATKSAQNRVAVAPDGTYIADNSNGAVRLSDLATKSSRYLALTDRCLDMAFTSGGTLMIVSEKGGVINIDPATGKEQAVPRLKPRR